MAADVASVGPFLYIIYLLLFFYIVCIAIELQTAVGALPRSNTAVDEWKVEEPESLLFISKSLSGVFC